MTTTKKLVFLYTGPIVSGSYPTYTQADITNYGVSEFVICASHNTYPIDEPVRGWTALTSSVVSLVNTIKNENSNNRVWISTPYINISVPDSTDPNDYYALAQHLKRYVDSIRLALGTADYNTYVNGIYYNYERIHHYDSSQMDYDNLINGTTFGNKQIKIMNDVSTYVKTATGGFNSKQFMWCPYYGYGTYEAYIIRDIGYVANKTNIFDVVILQPSHYFIGNLQANLNGVRESIRKGYACWRDGVTVVAKTSSTQIGCQMEVDQMYFWGNSEEGISAETYQQRYQDYLNYFNNVTNPIEGFDKNNYLFSYYAGGKQTDSSIQIGITNLIRTFYCSLK